MSSSSSQPGTAAGKSDQEPGTRPDSRQAATKTPGPPSRLATTPRPFSRAAQKSAPPPGFVGIKEDYVFKHHAKDGIYCLQYSPNGNSLAVGYGDSALEIVDPKTGKVEKELHRHKYGAMVTMCAKFNPVMPQTLLATHGEGSVMSYNLENMSCKELIRESKEEILCLDYNWDGSYLATGGVSMDLFVYDVRTNRKLWTLAGYDTRNTIEDQGGHARRIFALRFHPTNSDIFLSGGWDGHVKIWDLRQSEPVARFISGPLVCGDGLDIKDGKVLTGSWRNTEAVQLFDFASGQLIDSYPLKIKPLSKDMKDSGGEFVYCARFCDHGVILAGGSGTQSVQAIDTNTKKVIGEVNLGASVQAMDCYDFGKQFAVGGMSLQMKLAKMI